MKHGSRRGQRTGSALLLLGGVVGCDAARPAPEATKERPAEAIAVQPVSAPAPRATQTSETAPTEPEPAAPRILSADELRDGGRLEPIHVEEKPQRLPPVDAPGQAKGIHWPQRPIAYPSTATP